MVLGEADVLNRMFGVRTVSWH